ncbi:MAG: hypothetical protein ACI4S2_13510 [Lachnospiraceae bacterium]
MFESDITWIEALSQLSLTVPVYFLMKKTVGCKKIWKQIPSWFLPAILYTLWNIYNVIVIRYPQILTDIISEQLAYELRAVCGIILMFVILPMIYEGRTLERYFFCSLLEIISLFSGLFRYVCMMLFKISGLYYVMEKMVFLLLLFRLFIECAPYFFCYYVFEKNFGDYRVLVNKHKIACSVLTVIIICMESGTAFFCVERNFLDIWRGIGGMAYLFFVIGTVIFMLKKDNRQIYRQKQLLENHYQSIRNQEEQVVSMQSEIGELLKAAEKLEKEKKYSEEELKHYGEELKKLHSKLRRVDYCDNLMLDAVLHNKEKECEEKNIKLDIRMQDISFGGVSDVDIFEVVYGMLEVAIDLVEMQEDKALKTIVISGKNLAGQVVIEVSIPSIASKNGKVLRKSRNQYKRLKRKAKVLRGQSVICTDKDYQKIVLGIPC